jgi:hypothetical protein
MEDIMRRHRPIPTGALWKYSYAWLTIGFFLASIVGHWYFGWRAYLNEQMEFHHPISTSDYLVQALRDTLENWQSEFLQLLWQVCGLAYFLYVGSPQSKEGDDRHEAKLDAILRAVNPAQAEEISRDLERQYPKN